MRSALLLVAMLNGLAFNAFAQTNPSALTDLPPTVRNDIARICLPVQYQSGATAYRDCIEEQITARDQTIEANTTDTALSNLSFDDRYAIQQVCGSNEADNSAQQCRANQITALLALPTPNFTSLSSDEQYVMQQTCFNAQSGAGAAAYRQCQLDEIQSVINTVAPVFANLSAVERNTLQLRCSSSQPRLADYRDCLVRGTSTIPTTSAETASVIASNSAPETTDVNQSLVNSATVQVQPDSAIPDSLSADSPLAFNDVTNTASTRPRLINPPNATDSADLPVATEPELNAALPSIAPETTIEPEANSALVSVNAASPATELETLGKPNQPSAQSNSSDDSTPSAENNDAAPADLVKHQLEQFKNFVVDSFNGLSQQGKLLVAAIVAMPIALWILLSGRRRKSYDDYEDAEYTRHNLKRRVMAQNDSLDFDDNDEPDRISSHWASEADSLFDDAPTLDPTPMVKPKYKPTLERAQPFEEEVAPTIKLERGSIAEQNSQISGFSNWLYKQTPAEQLSLSIEFLLYWVAFGDERFDPSLKRRIFQTPDPTNQDIIKRWVLKEDVHAFSDVIDWVQQNTSGIQKEQIIRLLMALLINGDVPTPVQNTVLRFLSDVFYLDNPTLETIFEEDFGSSLPAMPRVDRVAWWQRQTPAAVSLWDARSIGDGDELLRHAAQLGLKRGARAEHIEAAYEQAFIRCNPERFDHLGEREHQLIASRRSRLLQAYDELMEALA